MCLHGFRGLSQKYFRIKDFKSWRVSPFNGPFANANQIDLPLVNLKKGDRHYIQFKIKLRVNYHEVQNPNGLTDHTFFFRLGHNSKDICLIFHIPKGKLSEIQKFKFSKLYNKDLLTEKEITFKSEDQHLSLQGITISQTSTTYQIKWTIMGQQRRGVMFQLVWFTKKSSTISLKNRLIFDTRATAQPIITLFESLSSYNGIRISSIIVYLLIIASAFYLLESKQLLFVISIVSGFLMILIQSSFDWFYTIAHNLFNRRRINFQIILPPDVKNTLRFYSTPQHLQNNRLLKNRYILEISKKDNITKIEALQNVIKKQIEHFNPGTNETKRTVARLRYEILRMMAFEGAIESQIMWDLGFDSHVRSQQEKLHHSKKKPRFPYDSASEYAATSSRSFKRLKKEAIEMLRHRLEEMVNHN